MHAIICLCALINRVQGGRAYEKITENRRRSIAEIFVRRIYEVCVNERGRKGNGRAGGRYGLSANGGLYVPEKFPQVTAAEMEAMLEMGYAERAAKIIKKYLDEYDSAELLSACESAYSKFEKATPRPL